MLHGQEYNDFQNKKRGHSDYAINGRTPLQKLKNDGFHQAEKILNFKVLYLDSHFYSLQNHLEYFYFQRDFKSTPLERFKNDRKVGIDLITKYQNLNLCTKCFDILPFCGGGSSF